MNQNRLPKFIYTRPTIINFLHILHLIEPITQMTNEEVECLAKYAEGKVNALEIGSYMGMSSMVILKNLASNGKLTCIDPWPKTNNSENPLYKIFKRQIKRSGYDDRIKIIRDFSTSKDLPLEDSYDFIFVDGDHSYEGLKNDWTIVTQKLTINGIVCLHDTKKVNENILGSVKFFNENIINDKNFLIVEQLHSLSVLKRLR